MQLLKVSFSLTGIANIFLNYFSGKAALENPDNPMFHEVFPSGHIYFTLLLERIEMMLQSLKPEVMI